MTRQRVFGQDIAFLDWVRQNPRLDSRVERTAITDIDVIIHRYRDRSEPNTKKRIDNILQLETKSHARGPVAGLVFSQDDTRSVYNAFLGSKVQRIRKKSNRGFGCVVSHLVRVNGEWRRVRWWGIHMLALSGDRPENSRAMWWNNLPEPISVETLEELLTFVRDPFNLDFIDYRDHHENERGIRPLLKACPSSL